MVSTSPPSNGWKEISAGIPGTGKSDHNSHKKAWVWCSDDKRQTGVPFVLAGQAGQEGLQPQLSWGRRPEKESILLQKGRLQDQSNERLTVCQIWHVSCLNPPRFSPQKVKFMKHCPHKHRANWCLSLWNAQVTAYLHLHNDIKSRNGKSLR